MDPCSESIVQHKNQKQIYLQQINVEVKLPMKMLVFFYIAHLSSELWLAIFVTSRLLFFPFFVIHVQVNGVKKHTAFHGLTPNTRYFVRVVAVGCRGKSQPTKWAKAKTSDDEISSRRRNVKKAPKKEVSAQSLQQPMGDGQSNQIGKEHHRFELPEYNIQISIFYFMLVS